jgi:type I restriction enzyme S subunit
MIADLESYANYAESGLQWVERVPGHWEIRPAFGAFVPNHERNHGMRVKTVLSLSHGRIVVKSADKLHGLVPESFETYQIVNPGDIVLRTTDLQNDRRSLRVGMVRNRGIITSAYLALRTSAGVIPEFGFQFLYVWDVRKAIYGYGSGLRQNLDFSHFKRMPIAVPPLAEQAAIVRFLDWANGRLDRAIRSKRKLIALLNEQKQAVIHQAVTCGVDPSAALKPTGKKWFPELPTHWEALPLRRVIAAAIDGPHFSPQYHDSGIPFLSARNVRADRWALGDVKFISEDDYAEFSRRVLPEIGDVLYTKGGTTGVARVVDLTFRFQVWVHIAVLKLQRSRVVPAFVAYCLNSPRCFEQAQLLTRGATNQDLGLGRMKDIELPIPQSLAEQHSIVKFLDAQTSSFRTAISRLEREIDLLREYRTRLSSDVVTGKVDVREAAAQLPADSLPDIAEVDVDLNDETEFADEEDAAA